MSKMLKSSGAMGLATLLSRILGMLRVIVYARFMGDTYIASAFVFAFQIPNLFRRLLGEGALTAAFIPVLKDTEIKAGKETMWKVANAALIALILTCCVAVGLIMLGCTLALWTADSSFETQLFLRLLRWMSPYILLVCMAAVFIGILNVRGYFFLPALGATSLNVIMICAVLFLAPRMGETLPEQIFGLAVGVLVAGVAQAGFQLPLLLREGYRPTWKTPWRSPEVKVVALRMVPGIIGVAAFQINVILSQWIAFMVDERIVASYDYAVRLMELPQGVIGVSLATYLLPTLSAMAAKKEFNDFRKTLVQGTGYLLYANIGITAVTLALAEPIVRLLFERGEFDFAATARAGLALRCLIPSLTAYALINIFSRAFYALGDVKTPMRISVFCLTANLLWSLFLIPAFKQGGMGVANTMSSWLNLFLLSYALRRSLRPIGFDRLRSEIYPILTAGIISGITAWVLGRLWSEHIGNATFPARLGEVFVPLSVGCMAYGGATYWLGVPVAREIWRLAKKRLDK